MKDSVTKTAQVAKPATFLKLFFFYFASPEIDVVKSKFCAKLIGIAINCVCGRECVSVCTYSVAFAGF